MNIYVGNLSRSTTEEETRKLFEPYCEVDSVDLITDRYSGEFRGFGFVGMGDKGAREAIVALNMKEVGDRNITVNEAKPRVRT
ncbi:MAG: RNA-binding protein [Gammaproteobacteria bacterium]|nr:RNA-binding protein [Gammaproteobacteria bacterium]